MSFEDIEAEINLLLNELEGDYGDRHEALERVRQMIDKTTAYGMQPPANLVALVAALEGPDAGQAMTAPPTGPSGLGRIAEKARADHEHHKARDSVFRHRS